MLKATYLIASYLSVDVSLGACATAYLVTSFHNVASPLMVYVLLGLSTLATYLSDHLIDAQKLKKESEKRRLFFVKNAKSIRLVLTAILLTLAIASIRFLAIKTILMSCGLVCLVIAYFIFLHKIGTKHFPKEIFIAVVYSMGIFMPYLILSTEKLNYLSFLLFFSIVLLALQNLLAYSIVDKNEDLSQGFASSLLFWSEKQHKFILNLIFIANFALIIILFCSKPEKNIHIAILILMQLAQMWVFYTRNQPFNKRYYRLVGDGAFLLPFLLTWID